MGVFEGPQHTFDHTPEINPVIAGKKLRGFETCLLRL